MSTPSSSDDVSPKVTAATVGSAIATAVSVLVVGALTRVVELSVLEQGAIATLVVAGVTFAVGYVKRDPARGPEGT